MNKLCNLLGVRRLLVYRQISTRLTAEGKEIPKRKILENRITLIGIDNSVSITDLKNAENLSIKRELKLVKIQDVNAKTRRPIYKLMTNAEYHSEELERRKEKQESHNKSLVKGQKLMSLSSKIGEHDLMTGVKKMVKLLDKQFEVKIIIAGDGNNNESNGSERIYSVIEKNIKSFGQVVQKRNKGNSLRFQLLPHREISSKTQDDLDSNKDKDNKGPL